MTDGLGIIAVVAGGVFFTVMVLRQLRRLEKVKRRQQLQKTRLKDVDWRLLEKNVRLVQKTPLKVRRELEGIIAVLVAEKNFEPCGGLSEVTEEMKLVIMAQAAFLLVGREHHYFPMLKSVLLYPDAYNAHGHDGDEETRLGESWSSGSIVLSWKSAVKGGEDAKDGRNVVLHEFSHQLDQENAASEGVPLLDDVSDYREWAEVFGKSYEEFTKRVDVGKKTVLDRYGATNPAEFFAVGTETFFEKGEQLQERYPELYVQMREYYGLDPASW